MKKAYFYIDDTIWCLRDITRNRPASAFDQLLLKTLKELHDKYGLKVQLNLFYRTDYFYGNDEFSLSDVTDAYKTEFEAASDWLKFAFHAKEEFPDYPHVNAKYSDVYDVFKAIEKEVFRFAGKDSFTYAVCPHWLPVSKAGVKALYDCGVRLLDSTSGTAEEYNGDVSSLPYGHAARLLNNRQPETKVFSRLSRDVAIENSICCYNHLTPEQDKTTSGNFGMHHDPETNMMLKRYFSTCINLTPLNEFDYEFAPFLNDEYIGICNHEQYFYPDYFAYQPDQPQKLEKMCEILTGNGYEFFFIEELVK